MGFDRIQATIQDEFWTRIRETVRREGIPYQWEALNDRVEGAQPSYCMRNFRIAAGKETGKHGGYVFQDSDAAKWLEGVAYSLRSHPDPELERVADAAIEEIVAAQQLDGYLDTYYIINGLEKRWTNLMDHHELYCAGHMIEAAVAYYQATGKRVLLDAVLRLVDHVDSVIGAEEGKLHGYPGHPVIEMALMRLYDVTQDPKHLKLAKYFIDQRGQSPLYFEEEIRRNGNHCWWSDSPLGFGYYQADKPVREQTEAQGHAVRAMYLYSGMADVARATGDESLKQACERLWENTVRRRMYVTGAVGSSDHGEAFTLDYDLPNDTIYGETCAAIGLAFFARRMLRMYPKSEYADVMERALYNGVLSGMQLDGKRFFYVNPLEVRPDACRKDFLKRHVKPVRQPWFGCACCPPNLIRTVMSLEDYVYEAREDALYVHLYAAGELTARREDGEVRIRMETNVPWGGDAALTVDCERPASFALALRIPGWCSRWSVKINGEMVSAPVREGYVLLDRVWRTGDEVELKMDTRPRFVRANPRVWEDAGKVALCFGPLVYCLEEADNGRNLHLIRVGGVRPEQMETAWEPESLGGITAVYTPGLRESEDWEGIYPECPAPEAHPVRLRWIPYYAWANRGEGEMRVWVRE